MNSLRQNGLSEFAVRESQVVRHLATRGHKYSLQMLRLVLSNGQLSFDILEFEHGNQIAAAINLRTEEAANARFDLYVSDAKVDGINYSHNRLEVRQ